MSNTPYDEGVAAFQQSHPTASCEYPVGSDQGREWLRGWTGGQMAGRDGAGPENNAHE